MIEQDRVQEQLAHVLTKTEFPFLSERYEGKVRDTYMHGEKRVIITTDRLSCFDVVVSSIPFKGQVLNQLAAHWFEKTKGIIQNHIVDLVDPSVMVVKPCQVLPVEVVVRGYLAGSAWRDYEAGRAISGVKLPPGLVQGSKLDQALITPSTKAPKGDHDLPISEEEIVKRGLVSAKRWQEVRECASALFAFGQQEAAKRGLLLVDTKYEFGLSGDTLILVDEIHTLDSSRYWIAESYADRFPRGEAAEMLDKEPTRQWLMGQGYRGDGPIPFFPDERRCEIAMHYLRAFSLIVGKELSPICGPELPRIEGALRRYFPVGSGAKVG